MELTKLDRLPNLKTVAEFLMGFGTDGNGDTVRQITEINAWGAARKVHHLKVWPSYFEKIVRGEKPFELRKNDRDFQEGELLCLWEFGDGEYSDRAVLANVTYVLKDCPQFGLMDGYCIMGVRVFSNRGLETE